MIRTHARRRTVRSTLAAGLACLLTGTALALGALLPATAAVEPDGPTQAGTIPSCAELFPDVTGERRNLRSLDGASSANDYYRGTVDAENLLDVEVLLPNIRVLGVFVDGPHVPDVGTGYYYSFLGSPYLQGDDLLDMYAPWDANGSPNDKGEYPPINHWLICGETVEEEPTCPPTEPLDVAAETKGQHPTEPPETCPPTEPTSPPPTEPTSPPPTEPTSPPPTEPTSPPPTETSPPPTTPAQPAPTTPAQPELPETGSGSNGWLAAAGAALLAAGTGLVLLGRRSGRHEA